MRKLLMAIMILIVNISYSQTYISLVPCLTNDIGKLSDKTNISFEIGKQYDCFSIGIDIGKSTLNTSLLDNTYFELRPNLNVFQQGKWTNTITCGIGYIFNDVNNEWLLTEVTSGIEYSYSDKIHLNINFGQFYYSGEKTQHSSTFFGVSIMRYFISYKPKSLIIKQQ